MADALRAAKGRPRRDGASSNLVKLTRKSTHSVQGIGIAAQAAAARMSVAAKAAPPPVLDSWEDLDLDLDSGGVGDAAAPRLPALKAILGGGGGLFGGGGGGSSSCRDGDDDDFLTSEVPGGKKPGEGEAGCGGGLDARALELAARLSARSAAAGPPPSSEAPAAAATKGAEKEDEPVVMVGLSRLCGFKVGADEAVTYAAQLRAELSGADAFVGRTNELFEIGAAFHATKARGPTFADELLLTAKQPPLAMAVAAAVAAQGGAGTGNGGAVPAQGVVAAAAAAAAAEAAAAARAEAALEEERAEVWVAVPYPAELEVGAGTAAAGDAPPEERAQADGLSSRLVPTASLWRRLFSTNDASAAAGAAADTRTPPSSPSPALPAVVGRVRGLLRACSQPLPWKVEVDEELVRLGARVAGSMATARADAWQRQRAARIEQLDEVRDLLLAQQREHEDKLDDLLDQRSDLADAMGGGGGGGGIFGSRFGVGGGEGGGGESFAGFASLLDDEGVEQAPAPTHTRPQTAGSLLLSDGQSQPHAPPMASLAKPAAAAAAAAAAKKKDAELAGAEAQTRHVLGQLLEKLDQVDELFGKLLDEEEEEDEEEDSGEGGVEEEESWREENGEDSEDSRDDEKGEAHSCFAKSKREMKPKKHGKALRAEGRGEEDGDAEADDEADAPQGPSRRRGSRPPADTPHCGDDGGATKGAAAPSDPSETSAAASLDTAHLPPPAAAPPPLPRRRALRPGAGATSAAQRGAGETPEATAARRQREAADLARAALALAQEELAGEASAAEAAARAAAARHAQEAAAGERARARATATAARLVGAASGHGGALQLVLVDGVLAMVLGRLPRRPGTGEAAHFATLAALHAELRSQWVREFSQLAKPPRGDWALAVPGKPPPPPPPAPGGTTRAPE